MLNRFRKFIETPLFGVCTWLGEKMGIKATTIRLYFIYVSFFIIKIPEMSCSSRTLPHADRSNIFFQ